MYTGYATVWDGRVLGPGESYFKPLRQRAGGIGIREGDLVFQFPVDAEDDPIVAGLAILRFSKNGDYRVVAIAPRKKWPTPLHPMEF
jgi:hypothetical protein